MALMKNENGTFEVKTLAQAKEAIENAQEIKAEIKEMVEDSTEMMRAASRFLVNNNKTGIKVGNKDFKVVWQHKRFWIGTSEDMPDPKPKGAKTLKSLVDKQTWLRLTKRVPDPDKIDLAISTGEVDEDEIASAFVEIPYGPHLRQQM